VENPALYATICQYPAEDTPRLVYADWLDEHAEHVGALGEAYRAHAELIRLQIEVARGPYCPVCHKTGTFRGTHEAWCALNKIDVGVDPGMYVEKDCPKCQYKQAANRVKLLLRTKYRCHPEKFGPAPLVPGEELWKPHKLLTAKEVRYSRGFVGVVSYTLGSYLKWADKLAVSAPLESVLLCDRRLRGDVPPFGKVGYFWVPYEVAKGSAIDTIAENEATPPGCVLPEFLFDLCVAFRDKDFAGDVSDCYRWLNWAALHYTRKACKLPDWTPRPEDRYVFPELKPGLPEYVFCEGGEPYRLTPSEFESPLLLQQLRDRNPHLFPYKGFAAWYTGDAFGIEDGGRINPAYNPGSYHGGPGPMGME
jgi:uncharacterized protein (TIGR02996 family)